jgi:membrane-bound ClpP family serine protease
MDYLTIALILIGIGVFLLLAEILMPTGGILVVAALFFFAFAVGIILYYGTTIEAVVAIVGLAIGLPATGYIAVLAWRRMSLDTVLDDPTAAPGAAPASEVEVLKGRTGKTVSPLRPSGSVEFDGKRVDAMTEGMMLDAGVWVRCVDVKRGQVIVRRMEEPAEEPAGRDVNLVLDVPSAPKAEAPPSEEPKKDEPKKPRDDFDDFDIGLDKS